MNKSLLVLFFCALLSAPVLVFYETSIELVGYWQQLNYRHAYLVPPLALLLMLACQKGLKPIEPCLPALLLLGISVALWVIANTVLVELVKHFAFVMIIISFVISVVGPHNAKTLAYPLLYLFLVVPVGDGAMPWLIKATTYLTTSGLTLSNIAFYREGNLLILTGGAFEVAEACSGFKFVMAGLSLSAYAAFDMFQKNTHRIIFLLLTALACVFLNGLRAFIVVTIASATQMEYLAEDHVWLGWLVFAIGFFLVITLGYRIAQWQGQSA